MMMAAAVTGSVGGLSHSMITTAEWHLWHIISNVRRSDEKPPYAVSAVAMPFLVLRCHPAMEQVIHLRL
jgi:hypothetical protein